MVLIRKKKCNGDRNGDGDGEKWAGNGDSNGDGDGEKWAGNGDKEMFCYGPIV